MEIEGAGKNCDVTRWDQFADIKDIRKEMFKRLENHFESWLNPWALAKWERALRGCNIKQ